MVDPCPCRHTSQVCQPYGSAYNHAVIRALWAIQLRTWELEARRAAQQAEEAG